MDHLPLPKQPLLNHIVVPYKCKEPYDGRPMLTYPERQGWEVLYSPFGISYLYGGNEPSDEELESFLQNWLYFGVIHDIFGHLINLESFISVGDNGNTITSEPLEHCCQQWELQLESWREREDPKGEEAAYKASKIIDHTWKVGLNTPHHRTETVVDPKIWISIAALCEAIEKTAYGSYANQVITNTWRTPDNPPIGNFIVREMLEKGWCPYDVKDIDCNMKSISTTYYLANLPPPRQNLDHSKCTESLCMSMSIGSDYKTKHMNPVGNCTCDDFEDTKAVINSLQGGGIPLLRATEHVIDASAPSFEIINSGTGTDFVAISHVWAEGLGNPHRNALPGCSLGWISRLVNQLPKIPSSTSNSTAFWIDTICVPTTPKEMHKIAMNRLRYPYQNAEHVLVLDSYLYMEDSSLLTGTEIWARVLCSSWSHRLWTFQEGRLAKSLWFQFSDKAIRMEDIFANRSIGAAAEVVMQELFVAYRGSNVIKKLEGTVPDEFRAQYRPTPDVRDMRESLKARAVSVASDEALCLFCMMNFDMDIVTTLTPSERMPHFWSLRRNVPVGLVFSSARQKLTIPGLRWAPVSFMGDMDTTHWYMEQVMEPRRDGFPTENGLQIQVPGFSLFPKLLLWDETFDVLFTDVRLPLRDEETGQWYFFELAGGLWNQSRTEFPKAGEEVAILLAYPMIPRAPESEGEDRFVFEPGVEAVVGIAGEDLGDDITKFMPYRHGRLCRFSRAISEMFDSVYDCVELFVLLACSPRPLPIDIITGRVITTEIEAGVAGVSLSDTEELNNDSESASDELPEVAEAGLNLDENEENETIDTAKANEQAADQEEEGEEEEEEGKGEEEDEEEEEEEDYNEDSSSDEENIPSSEPQETPSNFILSDVRRERCQSFALTFARLNPRARELSIALGRVQGRDEQSSFEQYAMHARFQLQMRGRNGMWRIEQERGWCID